ncbi:hypothetical protein OROGR_027944 [Orobanche gracilis]
MENKTYNVQFLTEEIETTVTSEASVVAKWIKSIRREEVRIVGLDVEWRPNFSSGRRNPVATLQLCIGERCLIYQIIHSHQIPRSLVSFLSLSRKFSHITFVGVGIKSDLEKLQSDYGIGGAARCVDLRELAAAEYDYKELERASLKMLASVVLGKEVEKPRAVTLSSWDEECLTPEQVKYACIDAYLSFALGNALGSQCTCCGLIFR